VLPPYESERVDRRSRRYRNGTGASISTPPVVETVKSAAPFPIQQRDRHPTRLPL
jgi:hypothetical protein